MRLPDILLKSVFFVYVKDHDGHLMAGGTGFFVNIPLQESSTQAAIYAVTARHVVEQASRYPETFLRLNTHSGPAAYVPITGAPWRYPENPASDVAVLTCRWPLEAVDTKWLSRDLFATGPVLERERIGIGDDLAILGLFYKRQGEQRNLPIARLGHIAAMPGEPMVDDDTGGPFDAFLAEIRSIGGLSGSPVFVVLEPGRVNQAGQIVLERKVFLLGLVRGHWDITRHRLPVDHAVQDAETVNMGIAIVTPIADVSAVLDSQDCVAERHALDRALTAQRAQATSPEARSEQA